MRNLPPGSVKGGDMAGSGKAPGDKTKWLAGNAPKADKLVTWGDIGPGGTLSSGPKPRVPGVHP